MPPMNDFEISESEDCFFAPATIVIERPGVAVFARPISVQMFERASVHAIFPRSSETTVRTRLADNQPIARPSMQT